jgi:nucleoside-diphosphate-sugar epimerase
MKKIAITGATGFVGNFVANYLESKGYEVYRFGRKKKERIINWDITNKNFKPPAVFDVVVHCAAHVTDWSSYKDFYSTNVAGTKNVLEAFSQAETFIYISSASVYNPTCKQTVINENTCVGGNNLNSYGKTKLLGEKEVEKSKYKSKIILRPHIIYGPNDTAIGPRIKKAIKHNYLIIPGDGNNHISFTHVENLSEAIYLSILRSPNGTSNYNITDAEAPMFNEAVEAFKKLNNLSFKNFYLPKSISFFIARIFEFIYLVLNLKKAPPLTPYIVRQMTGDHILDISKAIKELQYSPKRNYKEDFYI